MTTETINGMTIKRADTLWASEPISIDYRGRRFSVTVEADGDDEYALWSYQITELDILDPWPWEGDNSGYDSGTAALGAAAYAIRQTVDDDTAGR